MLPVQKYAKNLIGEVPKDFCCPICMSVIVNARSCENGHTVCNLCLEEWLSKSNSCPTCREPYPKGGTKVPSLDRTINGFPAQCLNKPCEWVGPINGVEQHLSECVFQLEQCPFGCKEGGHFKSDLATPRVLVAHQEAMMKLIHTLNKKVEAQANQLRITERIIGEQGNQFYEVKRDVYNLKLSQGEQARMLSEIESRVDHQIQGHESESSERKRKHNSEDPKHVTRRRVHLTLPNILSSGNISMKALLYITSLKNFRQTDCENVKVWLRKFLAQPLNINSTTATKAAKLIILLSMHGDEADRVMQFLFEQTKKSYDPEIENLIRNIRVIQDDALRASSSYNAPESPVYVPNQEPTSRSTAISSAEPATYPDRFHHEPEAQGEYISRRMEIASAFSNTDSEDEFS